MDLVINTISITPNRGGVKTYIKNMVKGILECKNKSDVNIICNKSNQKMFEEETSNHENVFIRTVPISGENPLTRIICNQILIPIVCLYLGGNVLISEGSTSTFLSPIKEIVILQAGLSIPSVREKIPSDIDPTISWVRKLYYTLRLPLTMKFANKIIAVSEYLKKELVDLYPRYEEKVEVVHEGVNCEMFCPQNGESNRQKKSCQGENYVLFVSTLFPYKRADQAVRGFACAIKKIRKQNVSKKYALKIAGKDPDGKRKKEIKSIAYEMGVEKRVHILGKVPHDEMPALYRGACALIFPSTVEAFGLPPLEAMACGTPVVASNRTAVPEVVGPAGLIVDPTRTQKLCEAVCRVLTDASLREELRGTGIRRARTFEWKRKSREVWRIIEDIG